MRRSLPYTLLVRSSDRLRCAEALRCAVGLTLRGARVCVLFQKESHAALQSPQDAHIEKALKMLHQLGHDLYTEEGLSHPLVESLSPEELLSLLAESELTQAW